MNNDSPFIEYPLSDAEVQQRRKLLEHYLDEQDKLGSRIGDYKSEIKETNAQLARVDAMVRQIRTEIRTRIVLLPRPPEPPRQPDLPGTGFAGSTRDGSLRATAVELPGTDVFTPSNLRPPAAPTGRQCAACDAVEGDGVVLKLFGGTLLCTEGTGCSVADDAPEINAHGMGAEDDTDCDPPNLSPEPVAGYDVRPSTVASDEHGRVTELETAPVATTEPDDDDPARAYAKFEEMYPLAVNPAGLHRELSFVLPEAEMPRLDQVAEWHPTSGIFHGVAQWARIERAHYENKARSVAGKPAIGGLTIPVRLAMPAPLQNIIGGEGFVAGSGKKKRASKPSKRKAAKDK